MADLAAKVACLKRRETYPDSPRSVEAKETHMSWAFLTDRYVYKLKKPVRTPFLDYGTIAARRLNCQREVRLNRRLAPEVYLGIVPLRIDTRTGIHLDGAGRTIDWLVKMKRLPAERTLERMIAAETISETEVRRLARRLAAFFTQAPVARITPRTYLRNFSEMIRNNHAELARPEFGLPKDEVNDLAATQLSFLTRHGDLLQSRARAQCIRDGHGDLRPEHIYFVGAPIVMDCLEFNRRLRTLDPLDELAYLAMECDRLGAPRIGPWVLDTYRREAGDSPPDTLVWFYKCFRAYLRAKIAIWHLDDAAVRARKKWRGRALQYLRCARGYAQILDGAINKAAPVHQCDRDEGGAG